MDWNGGGNGKGFGNMSAESSFGFIHNCNYEQYYSGMEARPMPMAMTMSTETETSMNMEKKKRLTNEQLESLERSFQEEIKLDPDRKTKLSGELGLHPRQVAVWFQNRRARWKTKQLERLYTALKRDFDAISDEKLRLQQEVVKLKSMLMMREQGGGKVMASTDASGDQTVESTWRRYEASLIT